jgi:hypothetical protein
MTCMGQGRTAGKIFDRITLDGAAEGEGDRIRSCLGGIQVEGMSGDEEGLVGRHGILLITSAKILKWESRTSQPLCLDHSYSVVKEECSILRSPLIPPINMFSIFVLVA